MCITIKLFTREFIYFADCGALLLLHVLGKGRFVHFLTQEKAASLAHVFDYQESFISMNAAT